MLNFEDFHKPGSEQFDYMKKVKKPFQILFGGHQRTADVPKIKRLEQKAR